MLLKAAITLVLISQALVPVLSQCTKLCDPTKQVLDFKTCTCVNKIDCLTLVDDPDECDLIDCNDPASSSICPKSCLCEQPSAQNNYCLPCHNGGKLDPKTCSCTCQPGFQGPRCHSPVDPSQAEDDAYCSNVNCWSASISDFFKCPRKCMWCRNKACKNLGKLRSDCTCECLVVPNPSNPTQNIYDETTDCDFRANTCADNDFCYTQFELSKTNKNNCQFDFVEVLCPKICGLCQPAVLG